MDSLDIEPNKRNYNKTPAFHRNKKNKYNRYTLRNFPPCPKCDTRPHEVRQFNGHEKEVYCHKCKLWIKLK